MSLFRFSPLFCLLALSAPMAADLNVGEKQDPVDPASGKQTWFPFSPKLDSFEECPIDLRFLNEKFAGEHGFIAVKSGHFIHSANGQPVRFWAVNGPPHMGFEPLMPNCS
jgi:hypothetical protein